MNQPSLELADVFRACRSEFACQFGDRLSAEQRKVVRAITACRTQELGGHVEQCDGCNHRQIAYNSCRNRHCPKCQASARAKWMSEREQELLPVPYFHVVFTIPHELAPLALQNKQAVYDILFRAAAETLKEVAKNPKHLGADIGFLGVLHTWGQNLMHHPHVHFVIPGGGLSQDRASWIPCKRSKDGKQAFFLPVRVLSRVFRGKFIAALKRAKHRGEIQLRGALRALDDGVAWERYLNQAVRNEWVVYAKRPFGGPQQVLKYLARYTHRVAISNQRLLSFTKGRVSFAYTDYANANRAKTMTLDGCEFMRRFLMHVLPHGFTRIRHFGFLSNRYRTSNLALCRQLLTTAAPAEQSSPEQAESKNDRILEDRSKCPICERGQMVIIEELLPPGRAVPPPHFRHIRLRTPTLDSS